jgi:hypothetical protein
LVDLVIHRLKPRRFLARSIAAFLGEDILARTPELPLSLPLVLGV